MCRLSCAGGGQRVFLLGRLGTLWASVVDAGNFVCSPAGLWSRRSGISFGGRHRSRNRRSRLGVPLWSVEPEVCQYYRRCRDTDAAVSEGTGGFHPVWAAGRATCQCARRLAADGRVEGPLCGRGGTWFSSPE